MSLKNHITQKNKFSRFKHINLKKESIKMYFKNFLESVDNNIKCLNCLNKYKFNDSIECYGCKYNQELELRRGLNKFKLIERKD